MDMVAAESDSLPNIDSEKLFDFSERLAEEAPEAARIFNNIEADARAAAGEDEARKKRRDDLVEEKHDLQRRIAIMRYEQERRSARYPADEQKIDKLEQKIPKLVAEHQKLFKMHSRGTLNLAPWATGLQPNAHFKPLAIKLDHPASEKYLKSNLAARADFLSEIKRIDSAPLPFEDALARGSAQIKRLAASGALNPRPLFRMQRGTGTKRYQGDIEWPDHVIQVPGSPVEYNSLAIMAWLHEDLLLERFKKVLRECTPDGTIPWSERTTKIAAVQEHLRALEFEEGRIIADLEIASGRPVPRRTDMLPEAALQIEVVLQKEAK